MSAQQPTPKLAQMAVFPSLTLEKKSDISASFSFGDLTVHAVELRATRDEVDISLSIRDLKILKLFSEHPGQVLTRDQIYNAAWGYHHMPNSRSLDQHISQLRKKIEPDPLAPTLIRTVHGAGYRYEKKSDRNDFC